MIRDILLLQKREIEEKLKEKFVERDIDYSKFKNNLIKVITGPRRAGKSHFLVFTFSKQQEILDMRILMMRCFAMLEITMK